MARAKAEGHRVVLVLATRGELGEYSPQALGPGESLTDRRVAELHAAAKVLGVDRVEFLGYRDSGMAAVRPDHARKVIRRPGVVSGGPHPTSGRSGWPPTPGGPAPGGLQEPGEVPGNPGGQVVDVGHHLARREEPEVAVVEVREKGDVEAAAVEDRPGWVHREEPR